MILITGASGFVGSHLIKFLNEFYGADSYFRFERKDFLNIVIPYNIKTIVHLAGYSHDLKNKSDIYKNNLDLTKNLFDKFLLSNAKTFIFISSIKAVVDEFDGEITEDLLPNPASDYGKFKYYAEQYILNSSNKTKKIFILRPCPVYGMKSNSNFYYLINFIKFGFPLPFSVFNGKRSFCSVHNLVFVISEIISSNIKPGVYNVADDESLSFNDLVLLVANYLNVKPRLILIPNYLIHFLSKVGDYLNLPFNTVNFNKLTHSFLVSNDKLKRNLQKPLPVSSHEGIFNLLKSLNNN